MNIRSLQNKLEDLQCFVKKEDCDVLLLTETWLKVNETFLYDIRNYKALHSCRDGRGGGASVYVKDTIRCCEISRSEPDSKINWLCVQLGDQDLKMSVVYKPPSVSNTEFLPLLEEILLKYPKNHLLVGDFNVNLLQDNNEIHNTITVDAATRVANNSRSIIDHVLSDRYSNLKCTIQVVSNSLSDHNLLSITIDVNIKVLAKRYRKEVIRIDHKKFISKFDKKIQTTEVESFQELIDMITLCKKDSEFTKTYKIRENNDWINQEILEMIEHRDKIYKQKVKEPGNTNLETEFKKHKNQVNNKIKVLRNRYFKNQWEKLGTNIKKQWGFVNRLVNNKASKTQIECMINDQQETHDKPLICKIIPEVCACIIEALKEHVKSTANPRSFSVIDH
nr:unnamed protein product [Callosobruchus chinensis]